MTPYRRLTEEAQGIFRSKGSKFLSLAFPCRSEESLEQKLEELKRLHHQASHWVFAYRSCPDQLEERSSDDGEPRHTAGTPALCGLKSLELFESAVVVVRYYGGSKLGKPGLIEAYRTASEEALKAAPFEWYEKKTAIDLLLDYPQLSHVQAVLNRLGIKPIALETTSRVRIPLEITEKEKHLLVNALGDDQRITFE